VDDSTSCATGRLRYSCLIVAISAVDIVVLLLWIHLGCGLSIEKLEGQAGEEVQAPHPRGWRVKG
jgi:hypothetical protein